MAKKVVLVTGASRAIGKAIAVKFAKKGYNVIINCAHREQELMQTKKEIVSYMVTCAAFLGDMGDMAVCEQLFSMIRKQFGSLDVLVNNAGIDYIGLLQDMSSEDWDHLPDFCLKLLQPGHSADASGRVPINPIHFLRLGLCRRFL